MSLIKPPAQPAVPGERVAGGIHVVAQGVIALAVLAAGGILWGWLMTLLATHLRSGVSGMLEICTLVVMGAMGVSAISFLVWAILQNPWFKQRARAREGR